jgi:peptidoglycan hydrolase-like protein with peptidoglycan-binding domain
MSREQVNEQQTQVDAATNAADTHDDVQGLPPRLYGLVMQLRPGDANGLYELMKLYGGAELGRAILAVASPRLGLSTVKRAQALLATNAQGQGGSLTSEDIHDGGQFAIASSSAPTATPEAPAVAAQPEAVVAQPVAPVTQPEPDAAQPAKHPEPTAAHPAKPVNHEAEPDTKQLTNRSLDGMDEAVKYNDAHPALVAEFQELTNDLCCDWDSGSKGPVDPTKVARWQVQHGLTGDGKIGPLTVAAARKAKRAPQVASVDPLGDDARPNV